MTVRNSVQVSINENVILQELEDEAVLLNLTDEHYFGLDGIGLRFWQLLEQHKNSDDVIRQLLLEYDTTEDALHHDLGKFIVELEQAELIKVTSSS